MQFALAKTISILFHPLFLITYVTLYFLWLNPYEFGVNDGSDQMPFLFLVLFSTVVIPGLAVVMMRFLGLVKSLEMKERHDRIFPYIITGIFYIWLATNVMKSSQAPRDYVAFILGAAIALFLAFLINNFSKVSAHAVGMGGLIAFFAIQLIIFHSPPIYLSFSNGAFWVIPLLVILMLVILITGLVCSSRLVLGAHTHTELYQGILIGILGNFASLLFI